MGAAKEENIRNLHPILRMYRNGGSTVNTLRAEQASSMMAIPVAPRTSATESATELKAVRRGRFLGVGAESELSKVPELKRRPRLNRVAPADNVLVNVFLDVQRQHTDLNNASTSTSVQGIVRKLRSLLMRNKSTARFAKQIMYTRNFVSSPVPVSALEDIAQWPGVTFARRADALTFAPPQPSTLGGKTSAPKRRDVKGVGYHQNGQGVLIGVIDVGGFDFAHEDFLDQNGDTRFIGIWDQGGRSRNPPERFDYGAELRGEHLNAAVKASRKANGLPAHVLEPQSQRSPGSHGTHVASIAAGNHGICSKAKIAAVLIDIPTPENQREERRSTFSDSTRILHAVHYLLDIAKREKLPVSINISLGTNGGAHDGSSGISRWIDALLAEPSRAICVAAGNAGQEKAAGDGDVGWVMGRIHTTGRIPARGLEVELEWTVVGNGIADISENELEIWYNPQDRIEVSVLPPSGKQWIKVAPQQFVENRRLDSGTTLSIYSELYHPTNGSNYIGIYLSPNLDPDKLAGVEAGLWRVRLRGEDIRDGTFHAWIERDDPFQVDGTGQTRIFRFPSFFSERSNVDSHSVNSLACGFRTISVANLDEAKQKISITSSQGPTRDSRQKPDVAAPGTDIVAAKGFSDSKDRWVAMSGTSMASPLVAGVVGLMLGANKALTSAQCIGILQRTARPLPGLSYAWQNDSGFGSIDPDAAVEEARQFSDRYKLD
jgi:subtilisin family serine protease